MPPPTPAVFAETVLVDMTGVSNARPPSGTHERLSIRSRVRVVVCGALAAIVWTERQSRGETIVEHNHHNVLGLSSGQ